jgi:pimeloyl-ACP methyl ester carboxylesterase
VRGMWALYLHKSLENTLPRFHDKPILIQFGEKDPMTGQGWPERWAREIPNHRVHMLKCAKHFPFEDAPEETVRGFRDWWAEIEHNLVRSKQ